MDTTALLSAQGCGLKPSVHVHSQSEYSTSASCNSTSVSLSSRAFSRLENNGGLRHSSPSSSNGGFGSRIQRSSMGRKPRRDSDIVPKAGEVSPGEIINNVPSPALGLEEFGNQWARKPRRIAVFVEPSPFAYVCGYKNRFQNFIRYLREMGDEVLVITTHHGAPEEFYGAKVMGSWSFPCPWYNILPLSLALSPRIIKAVRDFKPDIIHCSSPGVMCFGALIIAKMLSLPLVLSYHTHVPVYIPKYTFSFLVGPMWAVIRLLHRAADVTLVTSHALGKELAAFKCALDERIRVWRKGVDSEGFNPRFKSAEYRKMLSAGESDKPLIVHVGRLGAEKNLDLMKPIMEQIPGARLAFIGDGPYRPELEKIFAGTPTVFTGMLQGDELSQAYASGDIFITPSESETLGFVVLEAMASGVPVVAARAGGIPDIVSDDGVTGFLFNPGDVDDAVGKLKKLIGSPELRKKMASAARADVENFDWRASTKSVRNEAYAAAAYFFWKKKMEGSRWLPWGAKKQEWSSA